MPKPNPEEILDQARQIRTEFSQRDSDLKDRRAERTRQGEVDIPTPYKRTATTYRSPAIAEEGRQAAGLISAKPVPHMVPPAPDAQPQTTVCEQWLDATRQELELANGNVGWKVGTAQLHDRIAWVYAGMKRRPYEGQPAAPEESKIEETAAWAVENDAFKREAGVAAVFDYRHVPTNTVYFRGDPWNPLAVYEIREIKEPELMLQFGLRKDRNGKYDHIPEGELISGEPEWETRATEKVTVYSYWDREWCLVLVAQPRPSFFGRGIGKEEALVLDKWQHGWGRVPYFACPAFETEMPEPEYQFDSPLDGLYAEVPHHNQIETMKLNVMYLTGYPSWQIVTKESGELILDDSGKAMTQVAFEPGYMHQGKPGQQVLPLPMDNGALLPQEAMLSAQRLRQYSLADIAKGVAPGADTANSAISQLRRLQRSSLQPMADNQARMWQQVFRFWLQRVKGEKGAGIGETVFVYSPDSGDYLGIGPEDIPTFNVQVKVTPDTGMDQLIEEKQAAELNRLGLISEIEFHERRGKENPDEYVRANVLERLWKLLEPQMSQMVLANLGNTNAIMQLIQANQQTGSARNAVPGIMEQVAAQQNGQLGPETTGMGSGSPQMPRSEGVRSPVVQTTTQPGLEGGLVRGTI